MTAAAESTPESTVDEPWGRVDEDGTVSVREADGWRVVGQYPDGSAEEALAYFERKYSDLASEVTLLEVRHRRGGASASDLRSAARAVSAKLDGAAAVGDLASLEARVAALTETLAAASETEAAAAREAVDEAVRARTELVEKAEALAARDPRSVQWKQATADLDALFDQWQAQQQNGPRLPKSTAQQLWKRFRDARSTVDKHRREFYAELDEAHKGVRDRKTALVEKAEALAPKGEDGIPAYRELLDQWKTAGRAGKKVDDALWARFKAAGDALYARADRTRGGRGRGISREDRREARAPRRGEGASPTSATSPRRARCSPASSVAGTRSAASSRATPSVPSTTTCARSSTPLRTREDADWKRNNPETKARANDMTRQLTDAIDKLEDELAAAKKSGDKQAIAEATEALEAREGVAQGPRRLTPPGEGSPRAVVHSVPDRQPTGGRSGTLPLWPSPFLYFADDRLSLAELSAARLDGDLVELGDAYIPADAVETSALRAGSLTALLGDTLAATHLTAAWIHGALPDAPRAPHRAARGPATTAPRAAAASLVYRDLAVDPARPAASSAGCWVTTPVRTLDDLARVVRRGRTTRGCCAARRGAAGPRRRCARPARRRAAAPQAGGADVPARRGGRGEVRTT